MPTKIDNNKIGYNNLYLCRFNLITRNLKVENEAFLRSFELLVYFQYEGIVYVKFNAPSDYYTNL